MLFFVASSSRCCPSEVAVYCDPISFRCGRAPDLFSGDGYILVFQHIGREWANNELRIDVNWPSIAHIQAR